ncbi:hypothetical protein BKA66DRAFT_544029 [Pyrenochaeta sp. MPI-SDFR-AT-0127]|nr:hypothetical protein BKA66DRAFT_544029 [Pyrenochaeta sp. MPI-SDFR-AT-0127]
MRGDFEDTPLSFEHYQGPSPPPKIVELPSTSSGSHLALVPRRPPAHGLGSSPISSFSRSSEVTSLQSPISSRTSYSGVDQERNHINIGIDFGTTYSGVSWAISGIHKPEIHTVKDWPKEKAVKVPTEVAYTRGTVQWGYSIPPDAERVSWFKLLLAEERLPPKVRDSRQLQHTRKLLQKLNKSAVDVTADYLRKLWEFTLADIKRQDPNSMEGMPFRIVLSVPANWPKAAQEKMRSAAKMAGLLDRQGLGLQTQLEFVGEPEAAAVAAFFEGTVRHNIRVGDIIVICDAGGGTVDIVTYEVDRVDPSIHLGEAISNEMDLCGSIFLDEGFLKYVEELIGKDKLSRLPKDVHHSLMRTWEQQIKTQFDNNTPEIPVIIPHEISKIIKHPLNRFKKGKGRENLTGDTMRFSSEIIKGIFDPVMRDILLLVNTQASETIKTMSRKPNAILLVGGLGGNKFLYQRLRAEFPADDSKVIQPEGAKTWASICRGAAIKGLTFDDVVDQPFPLVTSYISKAHYGMVIQEPFDSSRHKEEDRRACPARHMDLAHNQMRWYVTKGHDVSKGDPVSMSWELSHPENRPRSTFSVKIYECEADIEPTRRTKEVHECATITFPVRWNDLETREGANGQRFKFVQFEVQMTLLGLGKLDFATYVDGKKAASKDVRVKLGGT